MAFPSTLSTLATPQPTDRLNSPSHSTLHQNENGAILEIERAIGTDSSIIGTIIGDLRNPNSNGGGHVQTAAKGGTGQTGYTKGDILVASSSSVLSKLGVGGDTLVLTSDSSQATGVRWASPAAVNVQSFVSGGVWIRPSGVSQTSRTLVELWGAGGGGGCASITGVASGGGGGSYINGFYSSSLLSASVLVGIGIGGTGAGPGGNGQGSVGGVTVFEPITSMLTAYGGGGGGGTTNVGAGVGDTGGTGGGIFMNGFRGNASSAEASIYGGFGGIPSGGNRSLPSNGGYIGSAGGGAGGGAGASVFGFGGTALYGGSGGGGATSSFVGTGGLPRAGGGGGNGSIVSSGGTGVSGTIPGGGGGGVYGTNAVAGAGGAGKAIITTFL